MTDIVERLRWPKIYQPRVDGEIAFEDLCQEAADTIEGLRGTMADMHGDVARLRTIVDLAMEHLKSTIETLERTEL